MTIRTITITLLCWMLLGAVQAHSEEQEILTIETTVTGSDEQPKMMTVVPWKKTAGEDLERRIESMIDQKLSPVEREELLREIRYGQTPDTRSP